MKIDKTLEQNTFLLLRYSHFFKIDAILAFFSNNEILIEACSCIAKYLFYRIET